VAKEPVTTIKLPKSLRDRLSRLAEEQGRTTANLIATLLDEHERRARFVSVGQAYGQTDSDYSQETADWESTANDGLDRD
jgi:predicted transcriptional regulator